MSDVLNSHPSSRQDNPAGKCDDSKGHGSKKSAHAAVHSCINYPLRRAVNRHTWAGGRKGNHTQQIFMSSASKYAMCSPGVLGAAAARLQMAAWRLPQLIMWAAKHGEAVFQKTMQRLRDQGKYWLPLPSAQNISWHEFNRPPTASNVCLDADGPRTFFPEFS